MGSGGSALAAWLVPVLVVPAAGVGLWALLTRFTGRHSVENAPYVVLRRLSGRVELRRYPPLLLAATDVSGERDVGRAQSAGFRRVAGYIFGGNVAAGAAPEAVAMTSPVLTQPVPVAMTSPVLTQAQAQQPLLGGQAADEPPVIRVAFVMPSKYQSLAALPKPTNPAVLLLEQPAHLELVESRTGLYPNPAARDAAAARLADVARREGLTPTAGAAPMTMNYDPPWAMPWMRLSEISLRIDDDDDAAGVQKSG
jgi:hypothetical protein